MPHYKCVVTTAALPPAIPPLCLARRAVYKPPRGGHRSRLTFALTHLAAARKAGIRFAMKCLARPLAKEALLRNNFKTINVRKANLVRR